MSNRLEKSGANYRFVRYMQWKLELHGVDKKMYFVCLRCCTTNEERHSAVAEKKLNNMLKLNLCEALGVNLCSAIRDIVYVVKGSYGSSPLC